MKNLLKLISFMSLLLAFGRASAENVALDNTTLTEGHLDSGTDFVVYLGGSYLPNWVNGQ